MPIELALTPDSLAEVAPAEFVAAAAGAGFASVGLAAKDATSEFAPVLRDAGIRCHDVLALLVGDDRVRTVTNAERTAAAASSVGASWVLAVFLGEVTPALKETVARSAEIISGAGARLGVEFSPLGPVATIPDALEIVDAAGPDRAGVVVDSWHLLHGPNPWEELTQLPLDRIAYVQFTDGFGEISMEETMSRRALPGEGELELERFVGTLRERGWEGVVSVEVLNRDLREMPVGESAARAYLATTSYWR